MVKRQDVDIKETFTRSKITRINRVMSSSTGDGDNLSSSTLAQTCGNRSAATDFDDEVIIGKGGFAKAKPQGSDLSMRIWEGLQSIWESLYKFINMFTEIADSRLQISRFCHKLRLEQKQEALLNGNDIICNHKGWLLHQPNFKNQHMLLLWCTNRRHHREK
ncbi:hypothetical protein L1987_54199 [Smallanthus sonchifolius]|uniref:Uncharacterized protein n=1 Tax=Smallanthus sonchifolius TaxID=185202 RepID=A0ACB9E6S7_9ASTR|nr:hypothetical protein L1987_54199 [Smallanthus sonchifolius]